MPDQGRTLTPVEAYDSLRWVMSQTRCVFIMALEDDFKKTGDPQYKPDLDVATLKGYCGFAQSFIDLTLKDYRIGVSHPFALQSLPERPYDHVALSVEIETTEGKKSFLFDPTFKQFCTGTDNDPGHILGNMPDGEHILHDLLTEGFVELTPTCALSYLSAFSKGICPFPVEKEALSFFSHPPESKYNRWFSRQFMENKGFVKTSPEIKP